MKKADVHDAKSHPPYPPEFRRQMVELVRVVAPEEFEPSAQASCNWVRQADRDADRRVSWAPPGRVPTASVRRNAHKALRGYYYSLT